MLHATQISQDIRCSFGDRDWMGRSVLWPNVSEKCEFKWFCFVYSKASRRHTYSILLGSTPEAATTLGLYRKRLAMGGLGFYDPVENAGAIKIRWRYHQMQVSPELGSCRSFTWASSSHEGNAQGNIWKGWQNLISTRRMCALPLARETAVDPLSLLPFISWISASPCPHLMRALPPREP